MKSSRWFLLAALLAASCKEDPAIAGKFKGNVMAHFDPTAPGGKTAQSDTAAADGVEITPLENSRYRVAFGGCSAVLERPTKSSANKGIWTFVSGGPCATKQGEATITGGELIDFEKGSFTLGLKGMTKDEKLNVSWTFVTAGGGNGG